MSFLSTNSHETPRRRPVFREASCNFVDRMQGLVNKFKIDPAQGFGRARGFFFFLLFNYDHKFLPCRSERSTKRSDAEAYINRERVTNV